MEGITVSILPMDISGYWSCTNQLRFKGKVLQQLWQSNSGEQKWEDVPIED